MNKEQFYAYLKEEKELDDDAIYQLEQVVEKYPYFQTAKLMLLKSRKDTQHPEFISGLKSFAVECCDREKLFYYLNDERFSRFFPKINSETESEDDRTALLLSSFLDSIEKDDVEDRKNSETHNQLGFDSIVSTDYLAYLEKTETEENRFGETKEAKPMKHQQLVDSFLEKSSGDEVLFSHTKNEEKGNQDSSQDVDSLLDDDTFLTETLAQVYIKQKKYQQALTIIKRLSLNFPNKSIYFADQIRFLEYLIINDKNKK